MAKTPIEGLQAAVTKILNEYGTGVERKSAECVKKAAQAGVTALKKSSAAAFGNGKYAKGWTKTVQDGRFFSTATIHHEYPGFPHLLEKSHAVYNQHGGSFGKTAGLVHIKPVEEELVKQFEIEIKAGIENL